MRNEQALEILQHVTEVSHGFTISPEHVESLKQWVRLEEEKSAGSVVIGVLVCKNLIKALEGARDQLPLHDAVTVPDSTATKANTSGTVRVSRAKKAVEAETPEKDPEPANEEPEAPVVEINGVPAAELVVPEVEAVEEPVTEMATAGTW